MRLPYETKSRRIKWTTHLYVQLCDFAWGFDDGAMEVYRPFVGPIPFTGTSAEKQWDGVTTHPLSRDVWDFRWGLADATTEDAAALETLDAASPNDRFLSQLIEYSGDRCHVDGLECCNHQAFLSESTSSCSALGPSHLGSTR